MLQLKEIKKSYTTGEFTQVALNNVSLNFRENEFVAILGQSGSGKTTFLNVIGGLDQYDSGDLVINGTSTKKFKARDWDAYRNNSVGFIFQNYNLIPHLGIIDNVEMGMTLSGVSKKERHKKAVEVLELVGLKEHIHKKPNQLSGGQMQRVAIARALANNPDIILADEPTGALDTQTSRQIIELIREIAKDKLVIMVTHNPEIAEKYADRIIRFQDGAVISDSNSPEDKALSSTYKLKKTSMSFLTALKLSGKNILTKKGRTALTAFASSIGIIGIAIVLSLSNGFDKQINSFETGSLSNFPITINQTAMSMDMTKMSGRAKERKKEEFPDAKVIYPYNSSENTVVHTNKLTDAYMNYLSKIDQTLLDGVSYTRSVNMNILKLTDGKATKVNTADVGYNSYPSKSGEMISAYLENYYDLLAGQFPQKDTDLVLVLDEYNHMETTALEALGFDYKKKSINLEDFVGKEYKIILNNDFYKKSGDIFVVNGNPADLSDLYNSKNAISVKISGIIRIKKDATVSAMSSGLAYSDGLAQRFIKDAKNSEIVQAQKKADYNVLTGERLVANVGISRMWQRGNGMNPGNNSGSQSLTKTDILANLGASTIPTSIALYPINYDAKSKITDYLDQWNVGLSEKDSIEYTDMAAIVTSLSENIMNAITLVLIAFAAISLVVSLIMIGIITWISVLERTKEIGILRALGARKKDISRVFNAETFIVGVCSGVLGVGIAFALTFPINRVLYHMTELKNVAQLNPLHAIALIIISLLLTMLGGAIPAKMAAKKDPIEALRTE